MNGEGNKKIGIDLAIDLVILKLVFVKTVGTLDYFDFLLLDQAENDHSFCWNPPTRWGEMYLTHLDRCLYKTSQSQYCDGVVAEKSTGSHH